MKHQKGAGGVSLLVLIIVAAFGWALYEAVPADAAQVQALVASAQQSPEARSVIAIALTQKPNPNKAELRTLELKVNEILVTEIARKEAGDPTIMLPSVVKEQLRAKEKLQAERAAIEIQAAKDLRSQKPLADMTPAEIMLWLKDRLLQVCLTFGSLVIVWVALSMMNRRKNGE